MSGGAGIFELNIVGWFAGETARRGGARIGARGTAIRSGVDSPLSKPSMAGGAFGRTVPRLEGTTVLVALVRGLGDAQPGREIAASAGEDLAILVSRALVDPLIEEKGARRQEHHSEAHPEVPADHQKAPSMPTDPNDVVTFTLGNPGRSSRDG